LATPEIKEFSSDHHLGPMMTGSEPFALPRAGAPHLDTVMKDITVGAALDKILDTFPGMWSYSECSIPGSDDRAYLLKFYRENIRSSN
jgi:hypothetical protein